MGIENLNLGNVPAAKTYTQQEYDAQAKQLADAQAQAGKANELQTMVDANNNYGPGYQAQTPGAQEQAAGVTPPGWRGITDVKTGQLLDQYKINPFAGAASQKLQQEAMSTGPSDWAKNALAKQAFEEGQARNAAGLQSQQAQSQAQAGLARNGGLGSGAATSLARQGMRNQLMASQNVGAQGISQRYGINDTDTQRRQQLLGQTADVERQADVANIGSMKGDLTNKATFDSNRYNQQMSAWAAKQAADATRAAGGGGGGKK